MARKRVFGLRPRRAPDGSAFQKCDFCGVSVPIAIYDMHECEFRKGQKRLKREVRNRNIEKGHKRLKTQVRDENIEKGYEKFDRNDDWNHESIGKESICNQPRSAFRVFMESFRKAKMTEDLIDVERRGFETWKNMSMQERLDYVVQAEKVNLAYEQALLREVDYSSEEDDEADSATVGKFDRNYYSYWKNTEMISGGSFSQSFESLKRFEWLI